MAICHGCVRIGYLNSRGDLRGRLAFEFDISSPVRIQGRRNLQLRGIQRASVGTTVFTGPEIVFGFCAELLLGYCITLLGSFYHPRCVVADVALAGLLVFIA